MLSFFQIIYILVAQASDGNIDDVLRIVERIYQEGSDFSKYLCNWPLESVMQVNNSRIDTYIRLIETYLDDAEIRRANP